MAARRAADLHGRSAGDSAVSGARQYRPLAIQAAAYFHHGNAVGVDFLAHFFGAAAFAGHQGRAIGVQQGCIDVFVVEYQQAVIAFLAAALCVNREEMHAVMVHAQLLGLILGAVAAIVQVSRVVAGDRRTPGDKGRGAVTSWYADAV